MTRVQNRKRTGCNLVLRELSVFLSTYPGLDKGLYYYRDDKGLEVGFIVERGWQWAGLEVKLSDAKVDEVAANHLRLRKKVAFGRGKVGGRSVLSIFMRTFISAPRPAGL